MNICGKGNFPECEYFTTGGCVSPSNCIYKIKQDFNTMATSNAMEISRNTISRVVAENKRLREEVDSLSHENDELEYKTEKLEAENAELKKRLENANNEIKSVEAENTWKKACELACEDLQFYDYGNEIKEDGIKMKLDYFYQQAKKELREEKNGGA